MIRVTATEPIVNTNLKLRMAIIESDIYWHAPNQTDWHDQTFRDMVPNPTGIAFTIVQGQTLDFMRSFSIPTALVEENCEIAVFVQSDNGHRILQGAKVGVMEIPPPPYELEPFSLISPADHDTIWTCFPSLIWHASSDPDSGYAIAYRIYLSQDAAFSSPMISDEIPDTSWLSPWCLMNDSTYFWKILASNGHAPDRFSAEVFRFTVDEGEIAIDPPCLHPLYTISNDTAEVVFAITNASYYPVTYVFSDSSDLISIPDNSGALDTFETDSIAVLFLTVGLAPGSYEDTVYVETNHPVDTFLKIPVTIEVYVHGDANCDNNVIGSDITFLVNYLRGIGIPPCSPFLRGDANGNCDITGSDVVFLVNYFRGGTPPIRGDCQY